MKENKIEKLREQLLPLYENLKSDVADLRPGKDEGGKAYFCMQWGKNFPEEANKGLLFVGRAVNGWKVPDYELKTFEQIFNLPDQMQWVENQEGASDSNSYNTNRSAFWNVIRETVRNYYPNNWSSYTAWSNVAKVSPWNGGNPSDSLYQAQIEDCKKIFDAEMEFLSPKFVIFLTGYNWAKDILSHLNGDKEPKPIEEKAWGQKYAARLYNISGLNCIVSEHPMGKPQDGHVECLTGIINEVIGR